MLKRQQKNIFLVMFLAIMLCVMEMALLVHDVGHLQDYISHSDLDQQGSQDKKTSSGLCQQCLAYAQADSAIIMSQFVLTLDFFTPVPHKIAVARLVSALTPTYSARAPPFV
jgi:predicted nucleic acid-binding Zn ribbon protein